MKPSKPFDLDIRVAPQVLARKEELITHLKVELIGTYPGCQFNVGDIITVRQKTDTSRLTNQNGDSIVFLHDDRFRVYDGYVTDYPAIFKILE